MTKCNYPKCANKWRVLCDNSLGKHSTETQDVINMSARLCTWGNTFCWFLFTSLWSHRSQQKIQERAVYRCHTMLLITRHWCGTTVHPGIMASNITWSRTIMMGHKSCWTTLTNHMLARFIYYLGKVVQKQWKPNKTDHDGSVNRAQVRLTWLLWSMARLVYISTETLCP